MPRSPGHVFYDRLQNLLTEAGLPQKVARAIVRRAHCRARTKRVGLIRLFLAYVVALSHVRTSVIGPLHMGLSTPYELGLNGAYAVMFFYVISGFLISTVLDQKYTSSRQSTFLFYESRFIRIFSLYWPAVVIVLLAFGTMGSFLSRELPDILTPLFLIGADWRAGFATYPTVYGEAMVGGLTQCLTLASELTFYLMAPFLLRSWRASIAALIISALIRAVLIATVGFDAIWTYIFFPSILVFFMLGHFTRVAAARWPILGNPRVGLSLLFVSLAIFLTNLPVMPDTRPFWLAAICFAAAIPGVFSCTKDNRFLNELGALSYPIYIVHVFILHEMLNTGLFQAISARFPDEIGPHVIVWAYLICVGLAAIAAHRLVEQPTAWLMRRAFSVRNFGRRAQIDPAT
jgi:peptidoglycan/LPS O-acetylase OafA/YrhL